MYWGAIEFVDDALDPLRERLPRLLRRGEMATVGVPSQSTDRHVDEVPCVPIEPVKRARGNPRTWSHPLNVERQNAHGGLRLLGSGRIRRAG